MNNLTPDYLRKRFQRHSEIHERATRQKNHLSLPKCMLTSGQRALPFVELKSLIPYLSSLEIRKVSMVLKREFLSIFLAHSS